MAFNNTADANGTTGDVRYEGVVGDKTSQGMTPMEEIGASGLKRSAGMIDEEFLPALRGRNAIKVFNEMALNDPIIASMLFAMDKLIRNVDWNVVSASNAPEDDEAKVFVEQCMEDMSHSWGGLISEILSMLAFGSAFHEVVYKRRVGPWETDPKKRSKYTDNKIGWRKMPIRSQETILRWLFDDDGGIKGIVQMAPPLFETNSIPISKGLLFRTGTHKGNPEGASLLRGAYRPWYAKKRIEEFEAIGIERDLAGMPVAHVPSDFMNAAPNSKEFRTYQGFKKMVQNVRRDAHEGIVMPSQFDEKGNQLYEFELLAAGGSRTFDTNAIIQRKNQEILMTCLADFILLGHEGQGSYAMHTDKTGIFRSAINTICQSIADVFNRHAIPKLFELNGWRPEELPTIVPGNVDPPDLAQLMAFMTGAAGLGMTFFPDPDLEEFMRKTAQLPDLPDDVMEQRRAQAQMQNQMQQAGVEQQHEMVGGGMSPEQAQQQQEAPTPDMMMQQGQGQAMADAKGQALAQQDPDVQAMNQQQQQQQIDASNAQAQTGPLAQAQGEAAAEADPDVQQMRANQQQQQMEQSAQEAQLKGGEQDPNYAAQQQDAEQTTQRDQKAKDKDAQRDERTNSVAHKRQMQIERIKAQHAKMIADRKAEGAAKAKIPVGTKPGEKKKNTADLKPNPFKRKS